MKLVYTRLARADLLAARAWYARCEPRLGAKFVTAVATTAKKLQEFPESAEIIYAPSFRRAVVQGFPYSLIYSIDAQKIVVVAVMHASRRPDTWKDKTRVSEKNTG